MLGLGFALFRLMKKQRLMVNQVGWLSIVTSEGNGDFWSISDQYRKDVNSLTDNYQTDMKVLSGKYRLELASVKYRVEMNEMANAIKGLLAIPKSHSYRNSVEGPPCEVTSSTSLITSKDIQCPSVLAKEVDVPMKEGEMEKPALFTTEEYFRSTLILRNVLKRYRETEDFRRISESLSWENPFWNDRLISLAVQLHHRVITEVLFNVPLQRQMINCALTRSCIRNIDWEYLLKLWKNILFPHPGLEPENVFGLSCIRDLDSTLYLYEIHSWLGTNNEATEVWCQMLLSKHSFGSDTPMNLRCFTDFLNSILTLRFHDCAHFELYSSLIQAWGNISRLDNVPKFPFLLMENFPNNNVAPGFLSLLLRYYTCGGHQDQIQSLFQSLEREFAVKPILILETLSSAVVDLTHCNRNCWAEAKLIVDQMICLFEKFDCKDVVVRKHITHAAIDLFRAYRRSVDGTEWPMEWNPHKNEAKSLVYRLEGLGLLVFEEIQEIAEDTPPGVFVDWCDRPGPSPGVFLDWCDKSGHTIRISFNRYTPWYIEGVLPLFDSNKD
jgi:hypothetical protein